MTKTVGEIAALAAAVGVVVGLVALSHVGHRGHSRRRGQKAEAEHNARDIMKACAAYRGRYAEWPDRLGRLIDAGVAPTLNESSFNCRPVKVSDIEFRREADGLHVVGTPFRMVRHGTDHGERFTITAPCGNERIEVDGSGAVMWHGAEK